jgi:hypothetical protein
MDATSLTEIIAAQRAYAAARSQAIQSAHASGADPKAIVRAQHQATLQYLQSRVATLTKARAQTLAQADAEIAKYQLQIDQVQQLIQKDGAAPTTPQTTNAAPAKPSPAPPNDPAASTAASAPPKQVAKANPKPGGK